MGACASAPRTLQQKSDEQLSTTQQLPNKLLPSSAIDQVSDVHATKPDRIQEEDCGPNNFAVTDEHFDGDSALVSDACTVPQPDATSNHQVANTAMADRVSAVSKLATASTCSTGSGSNPSLQATQAGRKVLMVEDSLMQIMQMPYNIFTSGPYKPGCDQERVPYSDKLHLMDSKLDAQIARILDSVSQVFKTSSVLLTLCEEQRVWIRNAIGFSAGDFPWRWAFCGLSLVPPTPMVVCIEDTHQDARFRDNLVVTGDPHIRNFAGAPLVASNCHRLGTLCFFGDQPRKFTAEEMVILVNMAELVVRELEKQSALETAAAAVQQRNAADVDALPMYLNRSLHCFTRQIVLFMDTHQHLWQTLYCNEAFCQETGLAFEDVIKVPFWRLFEPPYDIGGEAWDATQEMAHGGGEFVVKGAAIAARPGNRYNLSFRPADRSALDVDSQPVGVPSDVLSAPQIEGRYYFCLVSVASMKSQTSWPVDHPLAAVSLARATLEPPIAGLTLGTLLGKGSFGQVYRGVYKGKPVAVKVCSGALSASRGKHVKAWAGVEAVKALKLNHPCIVHTLKHTSVLLREGNIVSTRNDSVFEESPMDSAHDGWDEEWFDEDDPHHPSFASSGFGGGSRDSGGCGSGIGSGGSATTASVEMQTWAILEYCDCGTLQSGIDKGMFRAECTCKPPSGPDLLVVVAIAAQLASGLSYLHENGIIHGDLAGGNILLVQDPTQPQGFSCKISDFGLSRDLRMTSVVKTKTYGTVTHMPPELLRSGELSKAADCYAFGIILWELCHGVRAYSGLTHTQIMAAVAIDQKQLRFAPSIDPRIAELGKRCMAFDPEQRPTFPEIQAELEQLRQQLT